MAGIADEGMVMASGKHVGATAGRLQRWLRRLARHDPTLVALALVVLIWLVNWPFGSLADVWLLTIKAAASVGIMLLLLLIQYLQRRHEAERERHAHTRH